MLSAIAWRNLWRNRRRTLVTMSAVAGGLTMILIANGFMHAMGDRILEGMTSSFLGHVQIHREGFREKRRPDLTIVGADLVLDAVRSTKGVEAASGRIYGLAHVSIVRSNDNDEVRHGGGEDISSPVASLLGVEPEQEKRVTDFANNITAGHWLAEETDVVVGSGLAKRNGIEIGDAFLPTAIDANGAMRGPWAVSDEVPRVVGIVQTGMEDFDTSTVFMTRTYLAKLQRMEGDVHEVAIRAKGESHPDLMKLDSLAEEIRREVAQARKSGGRVTTLTASRPLRVALEESDAEKRGANAAPDADLDAESIALTKALQLRLVGIEVLRTDDPMPHSEGSPSKLLQGRFLGQSDDIVLAAAVARDLGATVGTRVVVDVPVDCGPHAVQADCPPSAENFTVVGIVTPTEPLLDGHFGLVANSVLSGNIRPLNEKLIINLSGDDARGVVALNQEVRGDVTASDEVLPWYGLAPELMAMLAAMDAGPLIMLFIIFLAVSVGIVNTMLMATFERTREIGMMMALGMRRRRVVALIMVESAFLGLIGVLAGLTLGGALVGYWSTTGVNVVGEGGFSFSGVTFDSTLWPRLTIDDLLKAGIPVFIMTTLAGLWPAIMAARLRATDALRHE